MTAWTIQQRFDFEGRGPIPPVKATFEMEVCAETKDEATRMAEEIALILAEYWSTPLGEVTRLYPERWLTEGRRPS